MQQEREKTNVQRGEAAGEVSWDLTVRKQCARAADSSKQDSRGETPATVFTQRSHQRVLALPIRANYGMQTNSLAAFRHALSSAALLGFSPEEVHVRTRLSECDAPDAFSADVLRLTSSFNVLGNQGNSMGPMLLRRERDALFMAPPGHFDSAAF